MDWAKQIRRWRRVGLCGLLCVAVPGLAIADTPTPPTKPAPATATPTAKTKHRVSAASTSSHAVAQKSRSSHGKKGSKYSSKKRGQQAIDSGRTRQIQTALIREHYMQGEPSGSWDNATQAAMKRYQADQGWQSKQIPDSRALIKLGLGPSHDHLLNPESAMTMPTTPPAASPKAAVKPVPADSIPKN
jgi:peptidoglycan hydrolase-like protein with peptidoglycan-binding domain